MTDRPRASLGRVVDDLGTTLLDLMYGDAGSSDEIGGIAIHDPHDDVVLPPRALVLGVGLASLESILAVIEDLGRRSATGLVIRAPAPSDPALRSASERTGVALLTLTRGASWTQLAAMLRSLLAEGEVGVSEAELLGGMPAGDLFALANAIEALLDAPVTIEDRNSRVLAFSGRQDEADSSRVETILGRQVPERFARMLAERGVFRELNRTTRPVYIEALPADGVSLARVAVAVRAGDEMLGSIWAAVHQPLSAERNEALWDASKLVALHLLRVRAGSDVERRLRADLLGTALEGGVGAREALNRLGLADQTVVVLAMAVSESADEPTADAAAELSSGRQRLGDALAMHLSAAQPRSATAIVGDVIYALVPLSHGADDGEQRAARLAHDFLDRVGDRTPAVVAIGPVARDVSGLARARVAADRVLRVLRTRNGSMRVAQLADVHVETLMLELRDIVATRGDEPTGAIARLLAYDAEHATHLVESLRAWLEAFGDVVEAAARVYVHPNTLRYRLRRAAAVGGIDLTDPEARFAAMVQLRTVVGD